MKKLGNFVVKFKYLVIAIFAILTLVSAGLSTRVETNDDIMSYIPSDIESIEGANIIKDSFDTDRTLYLLVKNVDEETANEVISDILSIEIDDEKAVSSIELSDSKKEDEAYLYSVVIAEETDAEEIYELSESINGILSDHDATGGAISGTETIMQDMQMTLTLIVTFIVISLVIILLTKSYFDVVIILGSVGVAILINNGTNIMFGNGISSITMSAASLIQLAVSVDYSLFIVNNFREQRQSGKEVDKAIPIAVKASAKSVLAGSVTTIAGFLALMFMKFELGSELGLVLAKGIIISLIVSLTLVPALIRVTYKLSEKFEHKTILPKFGFIVRNSRKTTSVAISLLLVVIAIFSYTSQRSMEYIYGEPPIGETAVYVTENFDMDNHLVFVYDKGEKRENVLEFKTALEEYTFIDEEQEGYEDGSINTVITKEVATNIALQEELAATTELVKACFLPEVPEGLEEMCEVVLESINDPIYAEVAATALITAQVHESFISDDHEIILIALNDPENKKESTNIFTTIENIREVANDSFENDTFLTGTSASFYDMKELLVVDDAVVGVVSILAVGLVIVLAFKSLSIPLLLLLGIQSAIWLNLALNSLLGGEMLMFMGVVMVSSMQLGASIDYSILLTEKYEYKRFKEGKSVSESILSAVENSSHSILTSGLALTISGLLMSIMQEGSLAQIGLLLGRGAFLSLVVSLFIFPHVIIITDKFIKKGTLGL